jgi:pimeloyl-ACP methyl ester carboxylesterase
MQNRILSLLSIWIVTLLTRGAIAEGSLPPVVFIPGHQGSTLESQTQRYWPPFKNATDIGIARTKERLQGLALFDQTPRKLVAYDIYEDWPFSFRIAGRDFELDFGSYRSLMLFLRGSVGYESSEILTFPYDWRKGLEENSASLEKSIKNFSRGHGGQKVVLVSHSMGGLVARHALNKHPDLPVHTLIQMGTPVAGLAKPAALSAKGKLFSGSNLIISEDELRDIILSFPSTYELQSDDSLLLNGQEQAIHETESWRKLFPGVYHGPRYSKLNTYLAAAKKSKSLCRRPIPVKDVRIVSTYYDTIRAINVGTEETEFLAAKGDGTVLRTSSIYPGVGNVDVFFVHNRHAFIPSDVGAQNKIARELYSAVGLSAPDKFNKEVPHSALLELESLDLHATIDGQAVMVKFVPTKPDKSNFLGNTFKVTAGWRGSDDPPRALEYSSNGYSGELILPSDPSEAYWISVSESDDEVFRIYGKIDFQE